MGILEALTDFLRPEFTPPGRTPNAPWKFFDGFTSGVDLLPWGEINAFLQNHWHDEDLVRMARGHEPVPQSRYVEPNQWRGRLRLDKFYEELEHGSTLVLENAAIGIGLVNNLEQIYERVLREEVASQVFVVGASAKGFGPHWDAYDVYVTQLNGRRHWSLYGITKPSPILEDFDFPKVPDGPPIAEVELKPGNVLYLPRGCWHDVHPPVSCSAHVTIAVSRRTGLDFLAWAIEEMRRNDVARADLPRGRDDNSVQTYLDRLRAELETRLNQSNLQRFLQREDSIAPARTIFSLPMVIDELDHWIARPLVGRARVEESGNVLIIVADGREIRLSRLDARLDLVPMLHFLVAERGGSCGLVRQYFKGVDDKTIARFIESLANLGLVALSPTDARNEA